MPETPLAGRTALSAGASRGLGAAAAEALAAAGASVILVARTQGGLEALHDRVKAAGGTAIIAPVDLTDDDAEGEVEDLIVEFLHVELEVVRQHPLQELDQVFNLD